MQATGLKGFRLSIQQARLWSLLGESQAYRAQCAVQLEGKLNIALFLHAFQYLIASHDILRTAFYCVPGMEVPLQVVVDHAELFCPVIDLEDLTEASQTAQLNECFAVLEKEAFDLEYAPLLYAGILRLSAEMHVLLICLPALCIDGTSLAQIVLKLTNSYCALLEGGSLTEDPLQYADVSAWQNKLLVSEDRELEREYWRQLDVSGLASMAVPFERDGQPAVPGDPEAALTHAFAPQMLQVALEEGLARHLSQAAQQAGVSLASWLLSCWSVLLWRLDEQPGVLLGVACDGRMYEDLEQALGLYSRVVPLRVPLAADLPFTQVLALLHTVLQEASKRQAYFRWPSPEGSSEQAGLPLFCPLSFEYERWPAVLSSQTLSVSLSRRRSCSEPFALKLSVLQVGAGLQVELHYDPRRLSVAAVGHLGELFAELLHSSLAQPQQAVGRLALLGARQQEQVRQWSLGPVRPRPALCLHQLFEQQEQRRPEQVAVLSGQEQLSYAQLNRHANQLARRLRRCGVGPNVLVGLCVRRSVGMLVGVLAILKAGGAYVPLDPESPAARLAWQLEDLGGPLVLTQQEVLGRLAQGPGRPLLLEQECAQAVQEDGDNLEALSRGQDLAYVIYTSGSTGAPKGVMISQQSIVNYTLAIGERLGIEAGQHFATVSTLAADLGNTAIFGALAWGGSLQVLDYEMLTSGEALAQWMQRHPIDVLKIVPSHLAALLAGEQTDRLLPRRVLVLGGEVLPSALLERVRELGGRCEVWNHYGPTETTVGVLVKALGRGQNWAGEERVTLGRPLGNTRVYVLDGRQQEVPVGVVGEVYVGGVGVAQGYWRQAEQTAEVFVPDGLGGREGGGRLYRTGDLGCYTAGGEIEFVGRRDSQVKLRGYRIEVAEIEAVLNRYPGIWESVVLLREDVVGEPRIVGYVVPRQQPGPGSGELRVFVQQYLPEYMVPSRFVVLERLPLTRNGKIDRQRLPKPDQSPIEERWRVLGAPRSPIEEILLDIWKQLLGVPSLSIHENFFQVGGHSLLATQVMAQVRAMLQVELSIRSLFETPTIAGLAQEVERTLQGGQAWQAPALVASPRAGEVPLSFAQQRLWLLDQLEPGSTAYLLPRAQRFQGSLDIRVLEHSLKELVGRHESLRTTFAERGGQPVQVIHAVGVFGMPLIDLGGLEAGEREEAARRLAAQEAGHPCDLALGPLLRAWLLRLDVQEHVLLVTMHHIISDGWSNDVLVRELSALYTAFLAGQPSPLPPLPIQYADFALWQRQYLQGDRLEQHVAYWKQQLADVPPLALPTDFPPPAQPSAQGTFQSLLLPLALQQQLVALSQQHDVTLFMTLLAAFQVLLARYSGQHDIAVGSPIANRTRPELEGLIGFFVNTLVLRSDLSGDPSFVQVLARVREVALSAYAHQDVPFEHLVEVLQPQRDLSRSPLFQVLFSLLPSAAPAPDLHAQLRSRPLAAERLAASGQGPVATIAAKFDLEVNVHSTPQGLLCGVAYRSELFAAPTIAGLLNHFALLLEQLVAQPQRPIRRLSLLSAAQRELLLRNKHRWRVPVAPHSLPQLLRRQAARTPDAIAVSGDGSSLTYQALDAHARRLGQQLRSLGVGPEVLVGLCLPRSLELVVGVLAIYQAGGAFVPLEPSWPAARLGLLLEETAAAVVLCAPGWQQRLPAGTARVLCVEPEEALVDQQQEAPSLEQAWSGPQQLAYVIYTSGSTGRPKGAMVEQGGLLNHLWAKIESLGLTASDRVGQTAGSSFDIWLWQALAVLLVGGAVEIVAQEVVQEPQRLFEDVQRRQLTVLEVVPSLLRAWWEQGTAAGGEAAEQVGSLRWLLATGEALPLELAQRWLASFPQVGLLNAYGPSECSDDVSHAVLRASELAGASRVPIGQAIANTQLYVLDEHGELVPPGVAGQLYVGGQSVGRGYLGDAVRTAEVFVPDGYGERAGGRLYRTGDRVRYGPGGQLEFMGRVDGQVKLRGYRIELGEIEAVLQEHEQVGQSVVVLRQDEQRLVGYVVGRAGQPAPSRERLESYLRERLPGYLVPGALVVLEELPLSANGKLDRGRLPEPEWGAGQQEQGQAGGRSQVEELLGGIWSEVLGRAEVGREENFFGLGGHSLLGAQVMARVRRVMGVEVGLRSLFEEPTVAGLGRQVEQAMRAEHRSERPALVAGERPLEVPLSFAQQRLWFLDQLEPGNRAYTISLAVRLQGTLNVAALERSVHELVRRHESLRTVFRIKGDKPVQVIKDVVTVCLPLTELSILLPEQRELEARRLAQQEIHRPFDLAQGPLLRTTLLRLLGEEHVLLLSMHHIISDGWSMNVLVHELTSLYSAFATGKTSPLPELPIQYADFALWQRQWLQGDVLEAQLDYWTRQLGGNTPLSLPTDHPRPEILSYQGADYPFTFSSACSEAIVALSRQEEVTLFMLLLAAFQTLLYRYTGQTDIVVGTDMANRTHVETEALIGFFINLLVLRNDLSGAPSFREVLRRTREMVLGAYSHQDTPFEMLVERLLPAQSPNRMPLVQVLFVLQNQPSPYAQLPNLVVSHFAGAETMTAKFELALFMQEWSGGLRGVVKYSSDLFEASSIATMMGRFEVLLRHIVAHPDTPIDVLDFYTDAEKTRQIEQQKKTLHKLKVTKGKEVNLSEM